MTGPGSGDLTRVSAHLRQVVIHLLSATPPGPVRVRAMNQARAILAEHLGDAGYHEWHRVMTDLLAEAELFDQAS